MANKETEQTSGMLRSHFTMSIAGLTIEADTPSPRTCILCRNYLVNDRKADIKVEITREDVECERRIGDPFGLGNKDLFLETTAAYRKIVDEALRFDVFLMHGAVVSVNGRAHMFCAPSGTGKTTHVKLWIDAVPGAYILNGDKPLVRFIDGLPVACGTPWCGSEHLGRNAIERLYSIVLMERAEAENHIEEVSFSNAFPGLVAQTHLPRNTEHARKTLELLTQLQGRVHFWRFRFDNRKDDCLDVAYNALCR